VLQLLLDDGYGKKIFFQNTACHCQKSYGIEPTWEWRVGLISPLMSYVMSQNLTGLIIRHDDGIL
jgi:hypothetical protein